MPGRPKLQMFAQTIESLGGDDWFFGQVEGAVSMPKIALQVGCSKSQLYAWMDLLPGRRERYERAKKMSAETLAEDAHDIPEELASRKVFAPQDVALAKLRVDTKMRRAAQIDPEHYGEKAGINVNVLNVGELHLDALRKLGSMSIAKPEIPVLEGHTEPDEAA
jgi:hypothetical protein